MVVSQKREPTTRPLASAVPPREPRPPRRFSPLPWNLVPISKVPHIRTVLARIRRAYSTSMRLRVQRRRPNPSPHPPSEISVVKDGNREPTLINYPSPWVDSFVIVAKWFNRAPRAGITFTRRALERRVMLSIITKKNKKQVFLSKNIRFCFFALVFIHHSTFFII